MNFRAGEVPPRASGYALPITTRFVARVVISPCKPSPPLRPAASSWTCFRPQ